MFNAQLRDNLTDFFGSKLLRVPEYQRPYSWDKQQWRDVLNDILDISEEKNGKKIEHYWGTITLFNTEENIEESGRTFTIYEVIDGQQRIVTIQLFLLALSKKITDNKTKESIINDYIKQDGVYRVILGFDEDDAYFRNLISGKKTSAKRRSHELLKGSLDYFCDELRKLGEEKIRKITSCLVRSNILEFVVYDKVMAVRAFQMLNDRGKPITLIDKAKSILSYYVVKYIPESEQEDLLEIVNDKFGDALKGYSRVITIGQKKDIGYLEKLSEDEFLRLFYHYFGYYANQEYSVKTIDFEKGKRKEREYVFDITTTDVIDFFLKHACENLSSKNKTKDDLNNFIIDFCEKFAEWAESFACLFEIIRCTKRYSNYRKLLHFQQLSAEIYPLIVNLHAKGFLTDELLRLIEVLDFRLYKVKRGDPKAELYRGLVSKIILLKSENEPVDIANFLIEYLKEECHDKEVMSYLKDVKVYGKTWVRYILWEYNKFYNRNFDDLNVNKFFNTIKIQIDHIFPGGLFNNIDDEKEKDNAAEKYKFKGFNDYKIFIDYLGNLLLFEYNQETKHKPPKKKIKYYGGK